MTGKQLLSIRRKLGLTQKELANELGIHWNSLARWERGEVRITEPVARLIRLTTAKRGEHS
jgi:DNA-binding transcriptional regulator YiaG